MYVCMCVSETGASCTNDLEYVFPLWMWSVVDFFLSLLLYSQHWHNTLNDSVIIQIKQAFYLQMNTNTVCQIRDIIRQNSK